MVFNTNTMPLVEATPTIIDRMSDLETILEGLGEIEQKKVQADQMQMQMLQTQCKLYSLRIGVLKQLVIWEIERRTLTAVSEKWGAISKEHMKLMIPMLCNKDSDYAKCIRNIRDQIQQSKELKERILGLGIDGAETALDNEDKEFEKSISGHFEFLVDDITLDFYSE